MEKTSYFYLMAEKVKHIFKSICNFLMDNLHQSQNLEYRLLKRGYILYQYEVLKQNKSFDIYRNDYLAEIHNFQYKTEKELAEKTRIHTRVSNMFSLRSDLITRYFDKDDFVFADYKHLIKAYNTTIAPEDKEEIVEAITEQPFPDTTEDKLAKIRAEILKYESGEKQPKHIGQRMFGYLLKANYFTAYNDQQRLTEWQNFTRLDSKPEMSYLRDPLYNKNSIDEEKFAIQLKQIEEFFYLIGLDLSVNYKTK